MDEVYTKKKKKIIILVHDGRKVVQHEYPFNVNVHLVDFRTIP